MGQIVFQQSSKEICFMKGSKFQIKLLQVES